MHHTGGHLAQLHLVGMWITFALTAAILLLVVGSLAQRLRLQQNQLARFRENRLRDEQIISLGLSAAAVAHRLGTPLNTMTLLLDEIRSQTEQQPTVAEDLDLMEQQLHLCSQHLRQLTRTAVQAKTAELETLPATTWVARLRESATLLWPAGPIHWPDQVPEALVAIDATLDQAVLNLVANALTASPRWVQISTRLTGENRLELSVKDKGEGLETTLQELPGDAIVDSRNGLGVGLFLSNATIQRLGGRLRAQADDTGTTMVVDLPIAREHPTEES
jgi:two-component system sensor histidine kinase RegB